MKLYNIICNRCYFVSVIFHLVWCRFVVVLAKCFGVSFLCTKIKHMQRNTAETVWISLKRRRATGGKSRWRCPWTIHFVKFQQRESSNGDILPLDRFVQWVWNFSLIGHITNKDSARFGKFQYILLHLFLKQVFSHTDRETASNASGWDGRNFCTKQQTDHTVCIISRDNEIIDHASPFLKLYRMQGISDVISTCRIALIKQMLYDDTTVVYCSTGMGDCLRAGKLSHLRNQPPRPTQPFILSG